MPQVSFKSQGLTLEGILQLPKEGGRLPGVVLCHPHPLWGGDMENNVVFALAQELTAKNTATLRFNFRGVGKSEGSFDEGQGEQEDALAALDFFTACPEVDPAKIGICGYSFGSLVAFRVAVRDPRVKAVAGVSPFVAPSELLNHYHRPKFFVSGTEDEYVDLQKLEALFASLPEPKEICLFPGVDHFWWGKTRELAARVATFFKQNL